VTGAEGAATDRLGRPLTNNAATGKFGVMPARCIVHVDRVRELLGQLEQIVALVDRDGAWRPEDGRRLSELRKDVIRLAECAQRDQIARALWRRITEPTEPMPDENVAGSCAA